MEMEFDWDGIFNEVLVKRDDPPWADTGYGLPFAGVPIVRHPYMPKGMILVMSQDGHHIEVAYVGTQKVEDPHPSRRVRLRLWVLRLYRRWQSWACDN